MAKRYKASPAMVSRLLGKQPRFTRSASYRSRIRGAPNTSAGFRVSEGPPQSPSGQSAIVEHVVGWTSMLEGEKRTNAIKSRLAQYAEALQEHYLVTTFPDYLLVREKPLAPVTEDFLLPGAWDDYVGHMLVGYDSKPYLVVERDRTGFWVRCLGPADIQVPLRSISEAAVGRTFHHNPRRCAHCVAADFAHHREQGRSAADIYQQRYQQTRPDDCPQCDGGREYPGHNCETCKGAGKVPQKET